MRNAGGLILCQLMVFTATAAAQQGGGGFRWPGAGGMAVIMFHGVGGGHSLNVSREAHRQVLRFLDKTATASGPTRSWP